MLAAGILHDVPGAPGLKIVSSPLVTAWARAFYGCPSLGGSYIVGGHWDPFFVGPGALMGPRY
jgi:hypothetical protein